MSWSSWQEGAGGGMLVDGRQDGGRVNNTQLIALFPSSWRKRKEILSQAAKDQANCALCSSGRTDQDSSHQNMVLMEAWCYFIKLHPFLPPNDRLNPLKRHKDPRVTELGWDVSVIKTAQNFSSTSFTLFFIHESPQNPANVGFWSLSYY